MWSLRSRVWRRWVVESVRLPQHRKFRGRALRAWRTLAELEDATGADAPSATELFRPEPPWREFQLWRVFAAASDWLLRGRCHGPRDGPWGGMPKWRAKPGGRIAQWWIGAITKPCSAKLRIEGEGERARRSRGPAAGAESRKDEASAEDQETKASERGVLLMPIIHGLAAQRYGLYYPFAQFGTQSVSAGDTLRVLNRTRLFPKANVQK